MSAAITKPVTASSLWQALEPACSAIASASDARPLHTRPLRILLAEDNVVNQTVAKRLLEKRGHQVVVFGDGAAAAAAVEAESFDVVLMDMQMPVMDGLDATKLIRERERGKGSHIPIIAMTANAMTRDREACLRAAWMPT